MAQKTIARMFQAILEDSAEKGELRDLLIDTGREHQRPVVHIGKDEFRLGLVDEKPMLLNVRDRTLIDPAVVGNAITGVSFLTEQKIGGKTTESGPGIPGAKQKV